MNPLSKTVVYDLEASEFPWEIAPGKSIQAWGFNNQLPGPVLRANAGDTMLIRLTNHLLKILPGEVDVLQLQRASSDSSSSIDQLRCPV